MIHHPDVEAKDDAGHEKHPRDTPYRTYAWPVRKRVAVRDQACVEIPQGQPQVS